MKKRVLAVVLFLVFSFSLFAMSANAQMPNVVDNADLLTESEELLLESQIQSVKDNYQFEVVIVTVNSLDGKTKQEYADDFYDYNGYGVDEEYSGALLLIDMNSRSWYVSTTGYGIQVIDQNGFYYIEQEMLPYLSDGYYYNAFSTFTDICEELITFENSGEEIPEIYYEDTAAIYQGSNEFNYPKTILISLIIGFVIALIIVLVMKGKLKTVKAKYNAADYVKPGSLNVTQSSEMFLYRHVNRVPKQQPKSGGGGGGVHVGSSGRSHGGGGGRF